MTVKMRKGFKRNMPGDVCGFDADTERMLVDKGIASFVGEEPEVEESGGEEVQSDPELALDDLSYGDLKKQAFKKAAEEGIDLSEELVDLKTDTLKSYLSE